MFVYKGFKCVKKPDGSWKVSFPGGGSFLTPKQSKEQLKAEIDKIHVE